MVDRVCCVEPSRIGKVYTDNQNMFYRVAVAIVNTLRRRALLQINICQMTMSNTTSRKHNLIPTKPTTSIRTITNDRVNSTQFCYGLAGPTRIRTTANDRVNFMQFVIDLLVPYVCLIPLNQDIRAYVALFFFLV